MIRPALRVLLVSLLAAASVDAQPASRRLTTVAAVRQFTGYYHLQNVLLRGEFATEGTLSVLRADDQELRVVFDDGVSAPNGVVDVRGHVIDVGRLEPGDPRVGSFAEGRDAEKWPRPGEELLLRVGAVSGTQPVSAAASVRSIALEPWRYDGEIVTIVGNFRGRNLFGDLPGAPGKSKFDFVLRGTEGALWVTDLRPRGQGFDLDINRRVDTEKWLEVTGTVVRERGLVSLKATRLRVAKAPQSFEIADELTVPPVSQTPVEVIFNSPTDQETNVSPRETIRIQFSRGLKESSLEGRVKLSYVGQKTEPGALDTPLKVSYDAANRAIQIKTAAPLEPYRTVRIELLEGITGFDGAPVTPWTMTFSVGG